MKIKQRILIVNPPQLVYENIRNNEKFIIYRKWQFEYFDSKKTKRLTYISDLPIGYNNHSFSKKDHQTILAMTYVWDRWLRGSYDPKIFRDQALIEFVKIRSFFSKNSFKKAIFYTAAPHHIDTSILSSCLHYLGIPEYYLFRIPVGGNYLVVKGSILFSKRKIENLKFIEFNPLKSIEKFISNFQLGKTPKMNTQLNWRKTNFYLSLIIGTIHFIFFSLCNRNKNRYLSSNHSFLRFYRDSISQKKFLNYYNKISKNCIEYEKIKRKIIIVANSQPEATTVPQGGRYTSHFDIVLKIRSIGYEEKIFYKEHSVTKIYFDTNVGPTGVGGYRSVEYLKSLINAQISLLPFKISNLRNDYKNWLITISSTVAIERSLLGLKTIVAGHPWFEGLPGLIPINQLSLSLLKKDPGPASLDISYRAKNFLKKKLKNNCLPFLNGKTTAEDVQIHSNFLKKFI